MKKLLQALALAALASAASPGGAMYLNPRGSGQLLLFPYFTVNAGQVTLLNLVNGGDRAKIVQVLVREGVNNRRLQTLDVVLAPRDSWTATLYAANDNGVAVLRSSDGSCTVPDKSAWQAAGDAFDLSLSTAAYTGANADGGPTDALRAREGSIQVIERAQLNGALANAAAGGSAARCGTFSTIDPASADLLPPGGGLYGNFAIVNVAAGTILGGNATAIEGFSSYKLIGANLPAELLTQGFGTLFPTPASDAVVSLGTRTTTLSYGGAFVTNAITALLMTDSLQADITREDAIGSDTEWVITAPTKHLHADPANRVTQLAPFAKAFNADGSGDACTQFLPLAYDRSGRAVKLQAEAVPGGAPVHPEQHLCFGTDVLYFANRPASGTSPILGSRLGSRLWNPATPFESGQVQIVLGSREFFPRRTFLPSGSVGPRLRGLPVIGFQAVRYINGNVLPGVLANYTLAQPLARTVGCTDTEGVAAPCN